MITAQDIQNQLILLADRQYAEFESKLNPRLKRECFIGVKTPILKKLAKELYTDEGINEFLSDTPHQYFEENQLHAFIISLYKDFRTCLDAVELFLPFVDNWATCDQLSPKVFTKHRHDLLEYIQKWLNSDHVYTVRFAIGILMAHYLDKDFDSKYPEWVSNIRSDEYYINMMTAWYFATALAKQYDSVIGYIESNRLDRWTHNKTIQKCIESYRITDEHKVYLRNLKLKA